MTGSDDSNTVFSKAASVTCIGSFIISFSSI
jgi:hypothetical protein